MIEKTASLEWVPEQEGILQQVQMEVPAALHLRLHSLILETRVVGKDAGQNLWLVLTDDHSGDA